MKKILLVRSADSNKGGVASFYNNIFPFLTALQVTDLQIGKSLKRKGRLYPLSDQIRYYKAVRQQLELVHLNPSLDFKSFIRDGLFAWQAKRMGLPLLVFWHGWDKEFEHEVEKKYMWFFRQTFGKADAFIVLATEFKNKLRNWGVTVPIHRETTNVEEGLTADIDVQNKWLMPEKLSPIKILFLARLERAKGVFETVQAIKLLLDKSHSVSLTVAGDGEIRQELEKYTRSLSLTKAQVHFTGDIRGQEKIRVFAEHHIYCFPTFYGEGLPTSVLEAMAFAMPVVTRPVGGIANIFTDDRMGKLVQGKSPEEIATCLETIIADPGTMAEIGLYNSVYAKEHFMASKVAVRLQKIYEQTMEDTDRAK